MLTRNATHKNLGPRALFHYRKKMAKYIPIPYFKVGFELIPFYLVLLSLYFGRVALLIVV